MSGEKELARQTVGLIRDLVSEASIFESLVYEKSLDIAENAYILGNADGSVALTAMSRNAIDTVAGYGALLSVFAKTFEKEAKG